MADEADRANDTAELYLRLALSQSAAVVPVEIKGDGHCINCEVAIEGDARWCDSECREDWMQYGQR
ncbi:MAG: DUF2116 family Zn-ribbon domain-containing protein [Pseudomonadota bacterium]